MSLLGGTMPPLRSNLHNNKFNLTVDLFYENISLKNNQQEFLYLHKETLFYNNNYEGSVFKCKSDKGIMKWTVDACF